ncbi:GNAT family N-acetyltransferase [Anaerocolumna sedimenticola]|uniref:GNAT family N-acetyltransferase n=1 Tax=Anaerocolumna sedimenticola TaxID=2696063 RepID=A0A6P1TT26_9FIRM|nr:GNAT family N-acetyltransferase [Anaerocolumna sedimenticola]QHQ63537.1 GNAT family N-acetyltransferase [Anaerocolumna sedimenticola]
MNLQIQLGTEKDIEELSQLYDDLNDYLEANVNYPGWRKGIYPVRENAVNGINGKHLYVAKCNEKIVGSIILSHEPEPAYNEVKWEIEADYSDVFVIHTLVVHPEYINCGVGSSLMDFAQQCGRKNHIKSIRLDVFEKNKPAIHLYEKSGYRYIDTVDLGLEMYGLKWFRLYEKIITEIL